MTETQKAQAARLTDALDDFRTSLMTEFHSTSDEDKGDALAALVDVLFDAETAVAQAVALLS